MGAKRQGLSNFAKMFYIVMSIFLCALGHEQERKFHELNIHIVKEANSDQNAVQDMRN